MSSRPLLVMTAGALLAVAPVAPAAAQTTTTSTVSEAAAQAASEQDAKASHDDNRFRLKLTPRPGLRVGDAVKVDLRALFQFDVRSLDPSIGNPPDDYELTRRRIGIDGELFNLVDFQVEAQLDDDEPWRDVYVNVKPKTWLQFRGGKFKVPFGRERLTGMADLDFVERTNATQAIAPGRDIGMMIHGRTRGRGVEYSVGVFGKSSANDVSSDRVDEQDAPSPGSTVATRVVIRPFRLRNRDGFGGLEIGFGATRTKVPEGLDGFRGEGLWGYDFFDHVYVKGTRWRWAVDVYAEGGPATFTAEYLEGSDDRLGQGLSDDDLPDLVARGWYMSGTYVVTGQPKAAVGRIRPAFFGGGIGAIEAAFRVDELRLGSREARGEPAFRNPRAVNLYPNVDQAWTLGINWYLNRYLRLQGDAIRERFSDPERTPLAGETVFWSLVARIQFAL